MLSILELKGLRLVLAAFGVFVLTAGAPVMADYDDDEDDYGYDDDDERQKPTIAGLVAKSGGQFDRKRYDYDILLNALIAAGLVDALDDPDADLTVFAPNDRAFVSLARDLGYHGWDEEGAFNAIVAALTELGGGDPIPVLTNVLLYHVSPESQRLREIKYSDVVETLLTDGTFVPYRWSLLDADPDFNNPRFVFFLSNVQASNGILHTINRVLIPADLPNPNPPTDSIVDIVLQSGGEFDRNRRDYDILLNAVLAAGLADALADPEADLTVFAPNDAAFIRLARSLGYRGYREADAYDFIVQALTDLSGGDPIALLTDILLYHVSPNTQVLKDVTLADTIDTLLGDATIHPRGLVLSDGASSLRDPRLQPRAGDIRASNGIIHTINRVLIPIEVGH